MTLGVRKELFVATSGRKSATVVRMLARVDSALTDVVSTLRGFAITTFDVPVDALARILPRQLAPETVRLDDGRERALVSAVTFLNTDFYVRYAPFVKLRAPQTNFRAYVRRGEASAVWFFGTTLGSPFVVLPRYLWRLPWAYGRHQVAFDFDATGHARALRFRATSEHGEETLDVVGTGERVGRLDGFPDAETTARVLVDPWTGYLRRRDGRYVTYGVDHPPIEGELATASRVRFELFERAGLVGSGQAPHSIVVRDRIRFLVKLPPRRIELD